MLLSLLYYLGKSGPTLAYKPDNTSLTEKDFMRMGNFFYLGVGQGVERNEGLYELPVPGFTNYHAIIYAFSIADRENNESRNPGKNYAIIAIIIPKFMRFSLKHPTSIESFLGEQISSFEDLRDLRDYWQNSLYYPKIFTYLWEFSSQNFFPPQLEHAAATLF